MTFASLESFPLKEDDHLYWQSYDQSYSQLLLRGRAEDGEVRTAINEGVGDGFMTITTRGRREFQIYHVFVMKIRRETFGLEKATHEERRQWCKMAQAFIDVFGNKTPPDIIKCLGEVREVFGVPQE